MAGGVAYAAGRRAGGDQGYDEEPYDEEPQEEVPPAPPQPESGGSDIDELQRLADLHASGALTDDEFAAAKANVLGM